MKREAAAENAPLVVPAVVSLTASSRRTLKHGDTFAMFDEFGDAIEVLRDPSGLFHYDTRHLSRLYFTVEGHRPLILSSTVQPDNVVLDVDLTNPDLFEGERLVMAKDMFHVARSKFLWNACCYEIFTVTSYAEAPVRLRCAIDFAADFADLFEIRGYRRTRRGAISSHVIGGSEVHFVYGSLDGVPRSTRICFTPTPTALDSARAEFEIPLAARQRRTISVTVQCLHTEHDIPAERRFFGALRHSRRSNARERAALPEITTSNSVFNTVLSRSTADLAMLMTETPHGPYPYAGVPWFSTAFGRDGILTALEMLWLDPSLARGVLRFLSAHQATCEDAGADMEPGKILHEVRECELARLGEVPFARYYGSVDSTPLFIVLAGLYWQRSRDAETMDLIWPGIKRALDWMERYGDRDGDGFI